VKILKVVLAARRNPEQNPKVSAYDYLKRWSDDPDVYISFTKLDKLGLNPRSIFNTPLGIYTYPLKEAWEKYEVDKERTLKVLPFAAQHPYIWVVRNLHQGKFVEDMYSDYNSSMFDRDEQVLKKMYIEHMKKRVDEDIENTNIFGKIFIEHRRKTEYAKLEDKWNQEILAQAIRTARVDNPISIFWNMCLILSMVLTGIEYSKADTKKGTMWNTMLRKCGYSGFADKSGKAVIHVSEPMQALFLTRSAFKVIGECYNRDYEATDARKEDEKLYQHIQEQLANPEKAYYMVCWLLSVKFDSMIQKQLKVPETPTAFWNSLNKPQLAHLQSVITVLAETEKRVVHLLPKLVSRCKFYLYHKIPK
jgi:hypothetical protein